MRCPQCEDEDFMPYVRVMDKQFISITDGFCTLCKVVEIKPGKLIPVDTKLKLKDNYIVVD